MNLIEELKWRGMIQDIMPGTEDQLKKEMTAGYIGFDPTSDSLHIGSLVPILLLVHLQKAGHKPVALVGGATGMVGDPSGKSEERNLLDEATLNHNLAGVKKQLEKFLDFDSAKPNKAEMVNNYDWFKNLSFLTFIRDVGKHITVNYMSAKDSVKKRLEGENGMSFTEFTYQLVQGYDFYWLYANKNCKLQMGGSDQWGNITTGTELIRRKSNGEAFAFTCPLLTKADGGKFGKTEKGNVWLDPNKTSVFQFYQFWLNASDLDAAKWIKMFTFLTELEINNLQIRQNQNPASRILQKSLAQEITVFVHGVTAFQQALLASQKLFDNQLSTQKLTIEDIQQLQGVAEYPISKSKIDQGIDIVSILADSGSFNSKGEARKMIQQGGLSMNGSKVKDHLKQVTENDLLSDHYILIQKGKKSYSLLHAMNYVQVFGPKAEDSSLLNTYIRYQNADISLVPDTQLGIEFEVSGTWEDDYLDWLIRDSAHKASHFIFSYLPDPKLTFYIFIEAQKDNYFTEKCIRFEPSFVKSDLYVNDPYEMAYVNELVQDGKFERSIVDIQKAVSETFGQGGWTYYSLKRFRARGKGKIKTVIVAKE